MKWWDKKAGDLQLKGRHDEFEKTDVYDDDEIRRAIKFTREDVIMLVSFLSSANEQLHSIRRYLFCITILAAFALFIILSKLKGVF